MPLSSGRKEGVMQKEIIKYDDQFKRTVVNMLESGEFKSIESIRKFFKIGGSDTVRKFLKQLNREDLLPKIKMRRLIDEVDEIKETDPEMYEKILLHME
jgi:hypothetical protein